MDKKKLRNDIILIASLILVAVIALVCVLSSRQKNNKYAKVYFQNELIETIDLSKKEEKDYPVDAFISDRHVEMMIHTKDGAIHVSKSNCPHQDCVNMGYVSVSNKPIICTYNQVYIIIEGKANYDLEI